MSESFSPVPIVQSLNNDVGANVWIEPLIVQRICGAQVSLAVALKPKKTNIRWWGIMVTFKENADKHSRENEILERLLQVVEILRQVEGKARYFFT